MTGTPPPEPMPTPAPKPADPEPTQPARDPERSRVHDPDDGQSEHPKN
jgi:hypothetical protein